MTDIDEIIFFVPKVTIVVTDSDNSDNSDSDTDNMTDSDSDNGDSDSDNGDNGDSDSVANDAPYIAPCAPKNQSFFSFRNATNIGSWRKAG